MTDPTGTSGGPRRDPLLPNALTIAKREYVERVRSRLFGASTLLLAALAVFVAMSPMILRAFDSGSVTRVAIVADDPALGRTVADTMNQILIVGSPGGGSTWTLTLVSSLEAVAGSQYDAALVVTRETSGRLAFDLRTSQDISADKKQLLEIGRASCRERVLPTV